ncbi:hypothetical protein [Pararhizobium sp.]|nr:hypothetical protein [Pararhizobium sp.]MDO9415720.1 hypothetical protein [Pararhizobium sp.]
MASSKSPANRLHQIVDESVQIANLVAGLSDDQFRDSWVWRRAVG